MVLLVFGFIFAGLFFLYFITNTRIAAKEIKKGRHFTFINYARDPAYKTLCDEVLFPIVKRAKISAPAFVVKESGFSQAYGTSLSKGKSPGLVVITTGLRALLSKDELKGVIAHEVGHIVRGDSLRRLIPASMCLALHTMFIFGIGLSLLLLVINVIEESPAITEFWLYLVFAEVASVVISLLALWHVRQNEYKADLAVLDLAPVGEAYITALHKLDDEKYSRERKAAIEILQRVSDGRLVNTLKKICPAMFQGNSLFNTHPPMEERIRRFGEALAVRRKQCP